MARVAAERLLAVVDAAIAGGAVAVQYRDKARDQQAAVCEQNAAMLRALCRRRGVLFIVNDDVRLAQRVDADGVHLGKDDAPIGSGAGRSWGRRSSLGFPVMRVWRLPC